MTHPRKTIRDAVKTMLDDGSIVASGEVYSNRSRSFLEESLPVINVLTTPESSERSDISTKSLIRQLEVSVEATIKVSGDDHVDDALDALAELIENRLSEDDSWNDTVIDAVLSSTEIETDSGANVPLGTITLTYTARYLTDS